MIEIMEKYFQRVFVDFKTVLTPHLSIVIVEKGIGVEAVKVILYLKIAFTKQLIPREFPVTRTTKQEVVMHNFNCKVPVA